MQTNERDVLVGVFDDRSQAQQAVNALKRAGFTDEQIGVISRENGTGASGTDSDDTYAGEGAVTGLAAGAGIGALWGLGILAGVIPGIGPAIAGGTLGVLLSSAAAGAAAAGIAGALVGLGIPEDEAKHYESEFNAGRTIITVKGSGRAAEAKKILQQFGAHDIQSRGQSSASMHTGTARTGMGTSQHTAAAAASLPPRPAAATGESIQLHEERVQVKKQPVETGEVTLRKEVHTEHKHIDVPVTKEEVVIERRPASGQSSASGITGNETIRVPVREEQVVVEKQTVATEEVAIGKRKTQHMEGVDTTIRKEEVKIDKKGDVDLNR